MVDDDGFWDTLASPDPNLEADLLKPSSQAILAPIETITPTSPLAAAENPILFATDVMVPEPEPEPFELNTELKFTKMYHDILNLDLGTQTTNQHGTTQHSTPHPSTPQQVTSLPYAPMDQPFPPWKGDTLTDYPVAEDSFLDLLNSEDLKLDDFELSTYGLLTPDASNPNGSASEALDVEVFLEPVIAENRALPVESYEEYKAYLTNVFCKMMFVSGETAEASAETTWLIEEIVREQVVHMLKVATEYANRRGHKSITVADLIFQIRHDKSKVSRLKTFLSWKDVRKNVKDSDDKGGGDAGDIDLEADGAQAPAAGGPAPKANKKQKLVLPWDVESYYAVQVPERDDEEDEEEDEQNEATLARLASADERTRNMTREEYVYWSDCRQASFTFRKGKRFREWAGFGTIVDAKPNDDVIDILGFLTFEIVQTLTENALRVKAEKDFANRKNAKGQGEKKRKREECSLFSMTEEGRTPVEPEHVREAFRRLQIPPKKATFFQTGWTGMRRPYRLI